MRHILPVFALSLPFVAQAADCTGTPPTYEPVATTFEEKCSPGQTIVVVAGAKSPVAKVNFGGSQEITVATQSGAKSSGGNGKNAQVCIWRSWDGSAPCGKSLVSQDGFNEWNGEASCSIKVPVGIQHIRALQINTDADEVNTTIEISCR